MFKRIPLILFTCILTQSISSCRKGSEDPLISFHSRAARVAGNWDIVHFNEDITTSYAYPNGVVLTNSFNRNFGPVNYMETTSDTGLTNQSNSGKISKAEFNFKQSGSWNSVLEYFLYNAQSVGGFYVSKTRIEEEGTWKFNGKTDGLKNKESMEVTTKKSNHFYYTYTSYLGTVIDSISDSTYSTNEKVATWKIIGLRNTHLKAVIESSSQITSVVSGIAGTKITSNNVADIELNQ